MTVQPHEQVLDMVHVPGDVAVKAHEDFAQEKEDIDADGIGHGLGQGLDLFLARIEIGKTPDKQTQQDQQGRAGGKSRGQKARRQDRSQPEMSAGHWA